MKSSKIKSFLGWIVKKVFPEGISVKLFFRGMIIFALVAIIGLFFGPMNMYILGWCVFGIFYLSFLWWITSND